MLNHEPFLAVSHRNFVGAIFFRRGQVEQPKLYVRRISRSKGYVVKFIPNGDLAIHVTDLSRAKTFYRDRLGFRLVKESDGTLVFDTGKFKLYVSQDDHDLPFIPSLSVKDYEAAKTFLKSSGCEIVEDRPTSKSLYFRDPLGQLIDIIETK